MTEDFTKGFFVYNDIRLTVVTIAKTDKLIPLIVRIGKNTY